MSGLGQISYMVRAGDCPVMDAGFCDKPESVGFVGLCCELGGDPECELADEGCSGKGGGVKHVPSGACSPSPGYRSNSTLEAYWQMLAGGVCDPEPPYACTPIDLPPSVTPAEAAARALFFALRVNSRSFRQLFDNVTAYYSCAYGSAAWQDIRTILCTHEIIACDSARPINCSECGNGVVDAGE